MKKKQKLSKEEKKVKNFYQYCLQSYRQIDKLKWECLACGQCFLTNLGFQYHFDNIHSNLVGSMLSYRARILYPHKQKIIR